MSHIFFHAQCTLHILYEAEGRTSSEGRVWTQSHYNELSFIWGTLNPLFHNEIKFMNLEDLEKTDLF